MENIDAPEISIGSIVLLNSGGPFLTVVAFKEDRKIEVVWATEDNEISSVILPEECFTLLTTEDLSKLYDQPGQ